MYYLNWEDDEYRCIKAAADGSELCEEHQRVKLCKTTGLRFMFSGSRYGIHAGLKTIPSHPVDDVFAPKRPTKRKQFCNDQCRNLWRDTRHRIERDEEIERVIDGKPSDRYSVIPNFNNTCSTVIYDKKTHRRLS